jgi:hypothetical protein
MKITPTKINIITLVTLMFMTSCLYLSQYDDITSQQILYCDMVDIYETSNGEYGWPDYQGNAQKLCK